MISNNQGVVSGAFAQLQRQQAERAADQAEQRARALQAETQRARSEAEQAQERARSLEVETDQATSEAQRARSGLAAARSLQQVGAQIGRLSEQLAPAAPAEAAAPAPARPVVNAQGEVTGTVINVSV